MGGCLSESHGSQRVEPAACALLCIKASFCTEMSNMQYPTLPIQCTYPSRAVLFLGSNDQVTFKGNYIHNTSGRGPKVGGKTVLHAVNNYWGNIDAAGHAFEIDAGAYVLAEGNVFNGVGSPVDSNVAGKLFTAEDPSACSGALGRACSANILTGSGAFKGTDVDILSQFSGNAAAADDDAKNVPSSAGIGKI